MSEVLFIKKCGAGKVVGLVKCHCSSMSSDAEFRFLTQRSLCRVSAFGDGGRGGDRQVSRGLTKLMVFMLHERAYLQK